MRVQRTIPIIIVATINRQNGVEGQAVPDLQAPVPERQVPVQELQAVATAALGNVQATLLAFQQVQQAVSQVAFDHLTQAKADHLKVDHKVDHQAKADPPTRLEASDPPMPKSPIANPRPLTSVALHRACYAAVKGQVSAQMTCTAIRIVAGAYWSAWHKGHAAQQPSVFRWPQAVWLIGKCCRDASLTYRPVPIQRPEPAAEGGPTAGEIRGVPEIRGDQGLISLWTVAGRRQVLFHVPQHFQDRLRSAVCVDALTIQARGNVKTNQRKTQNKRKTKAEGKKPVGVQESWADSSLRAWLTVTLEMPDAAAVVPKSAVPKSAVPKSAVPKSADWKPIGIDRNAVNALVAVDSDDRVLFISGREHQQRNVRTGQVAAQVRQKLKSKEGKEKVDKMEVNTNRALPDPKALPEGVDHQVAKARTKDTHSMRRLLKRLSLKREHRNRTFAQEAAAVLCGWAAPGAAFVLEDLRLSPHQRTRGGQTQGRLPDWFHGLLRRCIENKAQERGIAVMDVLAAFTSVLCSRCGKKGQRKRHTFVCHSCGHEEHADINAARNIRDFSGFPGLAALQRIEADMNIKTGMMEDGAAET